VALASPKVNFVTSDNRQVKFWLVDFISSTGGMFYSRCQLPVLMPVIGNSVCCEICVAALSIVASKSPVKCMHKHDGKVCLESFLNALNTHGISVYKSLHVHICLIIHEYVVLFIIGSCGISYQVERLGSQVCISYCYL